MESNFNIYNDDCLDRLNKIKADSIDCIVTDPPYELNFMGKGWDNAGVSFNKTTWQKCLNVLKPGGYLLAFGGTRTYHRIACAIEDAGFEIRDCVLWVYGSGFPKSMNIGLAVDKKLGNESKVVGEGRSGTSSRAYQSEETTTAGAYQLKEAQNEWKGWGTALKPSYEPIIVARKPFKGSLVDNVMEYGVGGINIDECRVNSANESATGRFPANTILTYDENDYDEVCGGFPDTKGGGKVKEKGTYRYCFGEKRSDKPMADGYDDSGSAARYFYCAKASRRDRDEGLEEFMEDTTDDGRNKPIDNPFLRGKTMRHNTHPTVKPTSLMQYLIRLVAPKGATILDPFMGSGSTGKAVMYENKDRDANYKFIGIEKDAEYCKIAEARIKYAEGGNDVKGA